MEKKRPRPNKRPVEPNKEENRKIHSLSLMRPPGLLYEIRFSYSPICEWSRIQIV
jgi:hypothetical protein